MVPARIRHVLRRLGRSPLFTAVAIATLGIGIGANTAIFGVVNGVLLKPLPYADPGRLVGVWHSAPGLNIPLLNQSPATYLTYREQSRVFTDIGLWNDEFVAITGAGEPERVPGLRVTDGLFPVLGVQPQIGRAFTKDDDAVNAPLRVMITDAFWRRKFAGEPSAIGKTIIVDGESAEIIGVLPAGFTFLAEQPQVIVPYQLDRAKVFFGNFSHQAIARLKPGVSIEAANADVARMLPLALESFPLPPGFTRQMFEATGMAPRVRPLSADVIGDVAPLLWILLGTVGIVLLIACANVANLFLIRAEGRQQELAVHAALGAGPGRVAWELLSESLALGLAGGVVGVGLAYAGIQLLVAVAPEGLPRIDEIGITPLVLVFTLGLSLVAGLLFGLLPVIKFARPKLASALKEGGRFGSDSRDRHRARNVLVVTEIALAVVLLVGSGLMIRSFDAMRRVQPGFSSPEELLTLRVSIPEALVKDGEQSVRVHQQIAERIAALPGVTSVGLTSSVTMDGSQSNDPGMVEDFPVPEGQMPTLRRYKWLGPGYFETMGTALVAGRLFTWNDLYTRNKVVLVNETLARLHWKDPQAALGRRIRNSPDDPWRTIVGVVADQRDDGAARPAPATIYWPMLMADYWSMDYAYRSIAYVIRTPRLKSPGLLKEIQQAVWSVNPNLPVASVRTMNELRAQSMAQTSFALVMLVIAAVVALLLGVVGIYGVVAYVAAQRTREVGIRMALGADASSVSRLLVRHGVLLTVSGVGIGLVAAGLMTRGMRSMLFGVTALDPATYLAVAIALGGTAVLASYLPARRAARVDPALALRWSA